MDKTPRKTLTVRLPVDLYDTSAQLARKKKVSLSALVEQGLHALARQEAETTLWDEFTLLGSDEGSDVDFALAAQSEVVTNG